jgi:hypothetical protein
MARLVAAAAIAVTAGYPQTAAELMQKGIYAQETAGDLNGAIAVYRQIVSSGSAPRDLAAQAQYRLSQSLLQKGDLGNAATEFSNLARNYADYGRLVSSMAAMAHGAVTAFPPGAGGRGGSPAAGGALEAQIAALQLKLAEMAAASAQALDSSKMTDLDKVKARLAEYQARLAEMRAEGLGPQVAGLFNGISFEGGMPVTIKGTVVESIMVNPNSVILIGPTETSGAKYAFQIASPRQMSLQGWTRQTVKLGDQVTITGVLANGGKMTGPDTLAARATTITSEDGRKLFDRAAVQQ